MKNCGKKGKFSRRVKKSGDLQQVRLGNPYRNEAADIGKVSPTTRQLFNEYDKNADNKRKSALDGFDLFL